MLTVMTETVVRDGFGDEWNEAYRERAADAQTQPGWVQLQLLIPIDDPSRRIVVGTWHDREAWERWHQTDTFRSTRERLDAATSSHGEDRWFTVVEEDSSANGASAER